MTIEDVKDAIEAVKEEWKSMAISVGIWAIGLVLGIIALTLCAAFMVWIIVTTLKIIGVETNG